MTKQEAIATNILYYNRTYVELKSGLQTHQTR